MTYRIATLLTLALSISLSLVHVASATKPSPEIKQTGSKKQTRKKSKKKAKLRPEFRAIQDNPKLPRVLLIGDSISMGYTLPVRRLLAGKANVHRISVNGGNTVRGLENLDAWLGDKPWDVIHFNWGLHDLKRLKNGKPDSSRPCVLSAEDYAKNLDKLVTRLKKTGATLIWATTTPIPKGSAGRIQGDEVVYNRAAAQVMAKHGVKVNDLHGHIMPKLSKAQRPNNVHFTKKGSELLANQVAKVVADSLADRKSTGSMKEE